MATNRSESGYLTLEEVTAQVKKTEETANFLAERMPRSLSQEILIGEFDDYPPQLSKIIATFPPKIEKFEVGDGKGIFYRKVSRVVHDEKHKKDYDGTILYVTQLTKLDVMKVNVASRLRRLFRIK